MESQAPDSRSGIRPGPGSFGTPGRFASVRLPLRKPYKRRTFRSPSWRCSGRSRLMLVLLVGSPPLSLQ